jgi:hypothetical protein
MGNPAAAWVFFEQTTPMYLFCFCFATPCSPVQPLFPALFFFWPPQTSNKKTIQAKNDLKKNFLFRVKLYARRLDMPPEIKSFFLSRFLPGLFFCCSCGVFLYELIPSDDPFIWCLCETFFRAAIFYFSTDTDDGLDWNGQQ